MLSLDYIVELNNQATRKAAKNKKQPYTPFSVEEIEHYGVIQFPAPKLGDYVPKGWTLIDTLFVDKTGFDSGPAMSLNQLKRYLITKQLDTKNTYGYGLGEEGQFQIHVKVYLKDKK